MFSLRPDYIPESTGGLTTVGKTMTDRSGYRPINVMVQEIQLSGRITQAFIEGYYDDPKGDNDEIELPRMARMLRSAATDPSLISQESMVLADKLQRAKELGARRRKLDQEKEALEKQAYEDFKAKGGRPEDLVRILQNNPATDGNPAT